MVLIADGIVARLLDRGGGGVRSSGGSKSAALTLLLLSEGQRNDWDYRFPKRAATAAYACLACSPAWRSHGGGGRENSSTCQVPVEQKAADVTRERGPKLDKKRKEGRGRSGGRFRAIDEEKEILREGPSAGRTCWEKLRTKVRLEGSARWYAVGLFLFLLFLFAAFAVLSRLAGRNEGPIDVRRS